MRHPIEACNQRQTEALASMPAAQREYMARLFRIGNASYRYYNQVNDLLIFDQTNAEEALEKVASTEDLLDWLEQQLLHQNESQSAPELMAIYFEEFLAGLPTDQLRNSVRACGEEEVKRSFPFRRYVLERHDQGMDEFLRMSLSADDYAFHLACAKPLEDRQ